MNGATMREQTRVEPLATHPDRILAAITPVLRSLRSEIVKAARVRFLAGTFGTATGLVVLATAGVWMALPERADEASAGVDDGASQLPLALTAMAGHNGMLAAFRFMAPQVAIVALCTAAAVFSAESRHGTWRNLVVRQSGRRQLLTGKLLAAALFASAVMVVAAVASGATALVMAMVRGVDIGDWWSISAAGEVVGTAAGAAGAAVLYAFLGSLLGLVLSSPAPAVSAGLGWLLLIEPVISTLATAASGWQLNWLPAAAARELIWRSTPAAALPVLLWAVGAAALGIVLFQRRDIRLS